MRDRIPFYPIIAIGGPHGSMPTKRGGRALKNASTSAHCSFRRSTALPVVATPCVWNTRLAMSMPIMVISMVDGSFSSLHSTARAWHIDAVRRLPHQIRSTKFTPLDRFRHLAQLEFLQLSSRCLGDFGEHDEVGTFVVGEMLTTPGDQLLRRRRSARLEFDKGARRLTPSLVWLGDHRGSLHRWVVVKHILDLDRRNVFAARDDNVLRTIFQLDVAVRMDDGQVARVKPTACEGFIGGEFVLEIALHHHIAAEHHLA